MVIDSSSCNWKSFNSIVVMACGIFVLLALTGCKNSQSGGLQEDTATSWQSEPGMSAGDIIDRMKQTYRQAEAYQDKAALKLGYRLQGSYLEEPHSWDVQFQREQGLNVDLFQARIRSDSSMLSCFVYDFSSGNLDNQWQVHAVDGCLPFQRLFQDGICRYYITGQDELPVNQENPLAVESFFPPTIGLLTGQKKIPWLENAKLVRMPDKDINGTACFQIGVTSSQMQWKLLIDSSSFLLAEITYPNQLLDARLQDNPDVEDLVIVAKFEQATLQPVFEHQHFKNTPPDDARIVSHFVAVPEPFPSDHIGQRVDRLDLRAIDNGLVRQEDWKGKITLLCWFDASTENASAGSELDEVFQSLPVKEYNIARVAVCNGVLPGNPGMTGKLRELSRKSGVPLLADYGFYGGRALGLTHYPVLAVIDRDGKLQFVKSLQDNSMSADDLNALLIRVRSGDDVAREMRTEYENFLDLYRERLNAAMTRAGSGGDHGEMVAASGPEHLRIVKKWSNGALQQPGNIRVRRNSVDNALIVLDGWRTVVQLDVDGHEQNRTILDLDSRETITIIRPGDRQSGLNVLFSVMGRTARILDENLNAVLAIETDGDQQRVRDAHLFDFDNDDEDELLISFTGSRGTELIELANPEQRNQISPGSFRSSTVIRRSDGKKVLVFCDANARLQSLASGEDEALPVACDLVAITSIAARLNAQGAPSICVTGTNQRGEWTAIGLDEELNQTWSVPIGSQRFETQIESASYAHLPGSRFGIWAIVGNDGSIRLIGDDGKLEDRWNPGVPIRGIEMVSTGKQYLALISTDGQIQCWSLSAATGFVHPASTSD